MQIEDNMKNSYHSFSDAPDNSISDYRCMKNDFWEVIRVFKCIKKEFMIYCVLNDDNSNGVRLCRKNG